jgi:hypothetical protein
MEEDMINRALGDAVCFASASCRICQRPKVTGTRPYLETMEQCFPDSRG